MVGQVKTIVCQTCGMPFFVGMYWVNDVEFCPKCKSEKLEEKGIYLI